MTTLPTLYKKTSTGATEQWNIRVEGNQIITQYGQVGGKLQEAVEVVATGKNLGKKNETSPEQQAALQAQSEWNKKVERKGYVADQARAEAGETDQEGGIQPMLAQPFKKHGHKISFPCFAQPKLDGIRCIAVVEPDGQVTLWSRERKPFTATPHISEELESLKLPVGTVLDGELYLHELKNDFEKIVSIVRKQKPTEQDIEQAKVLQYHVYDLPRYPDWKGSPVSFNARNMMLSSLRLSTAPSLVVVETVWVHNEDGLQKYFDMCRACEYEGCMARQQDGTYQEGKRSYFLQKLKEMDDNEYRIVDVKEGTGKMAGKAVFICEAPEDADDDTFDCKKDGPLDLLRGYWENPETCVGKLLTVQHQGFTKYKLPRFPVGKTIRDYE